MFKSLKTIASAAINASKEAASKELWERRGVSAERSASVYFAMKEIDSAGYAYQVLAKEKARLDKECDRLLSIESRLS